MGKESIIVQSYKFLLDASEFLLTSVEVVDFHITDTYSNLGLKQ